VTDRAATEERLRQALAETERARRSAEQADQAKSRFLAAASHDLRQPLQATRLFLEVLARRLHDHDGREILEHAMDALAGGDDLLKSLLDLSALQSETVRLDVRAVAIQPLFGRLLAECAPLAAAKGLRLRSVSGAAVVSSDPVMLRRMLRNLLSNAIRYTSQGSVLLGCRRRGPDVLISVVDTGCGIAEGERDLIFEEFYQAGGRTRRSVEGLGLGLAIVRRQAALLGHRLDLKSRPGHGSTFSVVVPGVRDAVPLVPVAAEVPAFPTLPALDRPILAIEDDLSQLRALTLVLEGWALPVSAVSGAEAALAAVARGLVPSLILCDQGLPGRSGIDLVRELRRLAGRMIPAALLTGDTDPGRQNEARAAGLAVLHKPFTVESLLALIHAQLTPPGSWRP
jgi:CheY-like chemotaxis protein